MADQLKVLTICGSLRKNSYNHALIRALPPLAPEGMTFIEAPPFDGFPFYNQDIQDASGFPAEVVAFADAVRAADAVLIVSPEYNWTIPGALKNAFDWVSRMKDQPFKEKPVALQSASGGPLGGSRMQYHLRQSLTYLNVFLFGTPEIFVSFAQTKFDKETLKLTDQPTKDILKTQLAAYAGFIKKMKA